MMSFALSCFLWLRSSPSTIANEQRWLEARRFLVRLGPKRTKKRAKADPGWVSFLGP
ncbi:MAG: hypothetical protein NVSMB14_07180 [Isosphaeraceae bacterium]